MVAFFAPAPHYVVPTSFKDAIDHLGYQTSLNWVIDAGDVRSAVNSSNQTLGVLPSGGSSIVRGNDTSADSDRDPVFRGTIGGQSSTEYWEMNDRPSPTASRRFTSPDTWWKGLHKNNALFTYAGWFYLSTSSVGKLLLFTSGADYSAVGFDFGAAFTTAAPFTINKLYIDVSNGSGTPSYQAGSSVLSAVPVDTPFFAAVAVDEAGNSGRFHLNGVSESFSPTYSSPSASDPTNPNVILGVGGDSSVGAELLHRLYSSAYWDRALSDTEITALYNATKAKFGL